jgi:formamidopyrimidine-DNA glycosylase
MLELPEAVVIAQQINGALTGKRIRRAAANQSPHKFAWYTGDPALYNDRLAEKTIGNASPLAGMVEIRVDDMTMALSTLMRYYAPGEKLPPKHQLLLEMADDSAFVCTVQMWGAMMCFRDDEAPGLFDYRTAKDKPSALDERFDRAYFNTLFNEETPKLSAKAFLATEQRIPGLGNGVLQDILWTARIHPRRKMAELKEADIERMFKAVKAVLKEMVARGGRDTETDLFGNPGRYTTVLSKNTVGKPCPACGTAIQKEAYLGGSIYYCAKCQEL